MSGYWNIIVPAETTNLVTNPSFEIDTTGWTYTGLNLQQNAGQALFGNYAGKAISNSVDANAIYAITLADTTHIFSAWVYVPTDWDGGDISITADGFTSATVGTSTTATNDATWTRIWVTVTPDSGDLSGNILIEPASAASSSLFFYVDGVQCEALTELTTYCDGDQPGCSWDGVPNASTSTRHELEPTGGYVRNFQDDYDFAISADMGAGYSPTSNLSSPLPIQPGALYEGQELQARQITFSGTIVGSTPSDFHSKRQAIFKALDPRSVKINNRPQARTLRYTGATVTKDLYGAYDGGMEAGLPAGFADANIQLRIRCDDPLFYQVGGNSAELDTHDTTNVRGVGARIGGVYSNLGNTSISGTGDVFAIAHHEGILYIGGDFTNYNGIANADYVVQYNMGTGVYSAMGTTTNGIVRAIAINGNGDVLVGGDFTQIGGVAANRIALWDGSTFSALGTGLSGACHAIDAFDAASAIVGGLFATAGGVTCNNVATWSGASWAAIGVTTKGTNNTVNAVIHTNDFVYVGGSFTQASGVAVGYVAKSINGSGDFTELGDGLNGVVNALYLTPSGLIYAGGDAFMAPPTGTTAVLNGDVWSNTNGGIGSCYAITGYNGGVLFSSVSATSGGMWQYNGYTFSPIDCEITPIDSRALLTIEDDIYFAANSATFRHAGITEITYTGTAEAFPVIKMTGTSTGSIPIRAITNITTGASITFDQSIFEDETITVDLDPRSPKVTSSIYGDLFSAIRTSSDIGQFYLMPGNDTSGLVNKIAVFTTTDSVDTFITWKNTYISQD